MIPINHNVKFLVGNGQASSRPYPPYGDLQIHFLDRLSAELRSNKEATRHADVVSFAFWCRKANLTSLRSKFDEGNHRLGLGSVFHIAPSNVPVNFAFTYAFGLLAGNANYVRLPSRPFEQIDIICRAINKVLLQDEFAEIRPLTHFFRYEHSDDTTAKISAASDARVIWGGDETVRTIRQLPITVRGIDIAFSDRYSFCAINSANLAALSDAELDKLATGFFNDTYLMDQNACSSPHLVVWIDKGKGQTKQRERFWSHLTRIVKEKYSLSLKSAVDKQLLLCQNSIELEGISATHTQETSVYRIDLEKLPQNLESIRGQCGYFYEYVTDDLNSVRHIVNTRYQTLTYFGVPKSELADFVVKNRLSGIDRIVPIGMALDIGIVWDGIDLIRTLSRIIDIK